MMDVKDRVHALTTKAIAYGALAPQPCERCGALPTEGHHEDYGKPYDARWLCKRHHLARHAELYRARVAADPTVRTRRALKMATTLMLSAIHYAMCHRDGHGADSARQASIYARRAARRALDLLGRES